MSKINVSLLLQTLGYIEENPDTWTQESWRSLPVTPEGKVAIQEATRCGANLCFAGHAAMLTGAKWQVDKKDLIAVVKTGKQDQIDSHEFNQALSLVKLTKKLVKKYEDELQDIRSDDNGSYLDRYSEVNHPLTKERLTGFTAGGFAQAALGLNETQAGVLFEAENNLATLRSIVLTLVKHQMELDDEWDDYDYLVED